MEEEIGHLKEIAGPPRHLCRVIAQEHFPVLTTNSFWASVLHIFLMSSFTHVNIQLEEFSTDTFRSKDVDCLSPFL